MIPTKVDEDEVRKIVGGLKGAKAVEAVRDLIVEDARQQYGEMEETIGETGLRDLERRVVLAVLGRWGGSFGTLRMGVDIFLVVVAATISLILYGEVIGVREGTLIGALLGGQLAKRFLLVWGRLFPKHRVVD